MMRGIVGRKYQYTIGKERKIKEMNICYVLYLAICVIVGAVMPLIGYDFKTYQYWVILGCVVSAYLCGYFAKGRSKK